MQHERRRFSRDQQQVRLPARISLAGPDCPVEALLDILPVGRLRHVALSGCPNQMRMAGQCTTLLIQACVLGDPADGLQQMNQDFGLGRSRLPDLMDHGVENAIIGGKLPLLYKNDRTVP